MKTRAFIWMVPTGLIIIALVAGTWFFYAPVATDRFLPGIHIARIPVGGLTLEEGRTLIEERAESSARQDLGVLWHNERLLLHPSRQYPYLRYQTETVIQEAYRLGRSQNLWQNILMQFHVRITEKNLPIPVALDTTQLERDLRQALGSRLRLATDARFLIHVAEDERVFSIDISDEQVGQDIRLDTLQERLLTQAKEMHVRDPLPLDIVTTLPKRTARDLMPLVPDAEAWMRYAPLTLSMEDKTWTIPTRTVGSWITATHTVQGWAIDLDPHLVAENLKKTLNDVLRAAVDGSLVVKDGRMETFTAPVEGIELDVPATITLLKVHTSKTSSTAIQLIHATPRILGDGETLGIREVLGVGRSEFSGSPTNRRKNIALGAKKVNGTLIAPEAEFSLLKTLGQIDGEHGWLPELVIKGNKTTPEFGGGLCQIGTTSFRGALTSGLPITERRNHSYRVRYYEPAGTDATIYDPAPDFRFKNDTQHWILITTDIKRDTAMFTFWGTRDGRIVEQTPSKIFNVVPPPPKKEIETLDLTPGTVKCTEVAHAGADASFDYIVSHPGEEPKKVTFYSHYRPWGAVCLKGVTQLSASSTTSHTASTTELLIP